MSNYINKKYLTCPITKLIFNDPVVASDGHTYEFLAISNWLKLHDTSPVTGGPLTKTLTRVFAIVDAIADHLEMYPEDKQHRFIVKKPFYLFEKEFFETIKNKQFDKIKDYATFELNYEYGKETLIEFVCRTCPEEAIKHIIDNSIDYDTEDKRHMRPIHTVCRLSTSNVIKHLLTKGVAIESEDVHGGRPIDYIVAYHFDDIELLTHFLDCGVSVNHETKQGCKIVHFIIHKGNLNVFKLFTGYGMNILGQVQRTGLNVLQYAFKFCPSIDLIKHLIDMDVNMDIDVSAKISCEQLIYQNTGLSKRQMQEIVYYYLGKILNRPIIEEKYLTETNDKKEEFEIVDKIKNC